MISLMPESPVGIALREGPRGDGKWLGFDVVWSKIQAAAHRMACARHIRLSQDHVDTMADLGSGHEERMKLRLWWLREYGWLQEEKA